MGQLENEFLLARELKPYYSERYIDDILSGITGRQNFWLSLRTLIRFIHPFRNHTHFSNHTHLSVFWMSQYPCVATN